jgi:CheY-like chemotaxis protein
MSKATALPSRILLVDDNHHGNVGRKLLLQGHGFEVETALSGEEALQMFLSHPFDLVVTDLRMGCMSGTELIARIRASGHSTSIILLSGYAGPLGLTEETSGADAVLCKSNKEGEQLHRTIEQLLTRRRRKGPGVEKAVRQKEPKKLKASVARSG